MGKGKVDWVAYTLRDGGLASQNIKNMLEVDRDIALNMAAGMSNEETWEGAWVQTNGMFGYRENFLSRYGARVLYGGGNGMGMHVIWSGSALSNSPITAHQIIGRAIENGAAFTRIDLAMDMCGGVTVRDFVGAYRVGNYKGRKRSEREILSGGGGHTLYIGSRASTRMLRIYDKAAQMGQPEKNWVRAELEIKGHTADGVARYLYKNWLSEAMMEVINGFIVFDTIDEWECTGAIEFGSEKGERNTRKWALGCVSTQSMMIRLDASFVIDFMKAFKEKGITISIDIDSADSA